MRRAALTDDLHHSKVLRLPWPSSELRQNARPHWALKARATKEARNHAWAVAMEAPRVDPDPEAVIFIEYYPKHHRMDVQNVHAMMKPYIDGIAEAMNVDDRLFQVNFPAVYAGKRNPGEVIFRILRRAAT